LVNSGTTLDELKEEEEEKYMVTSDMTVPWLTQ